MITFIIKLFGYYLLLFLSVRFRNALMKSCKKEGEYKTNHIIVDLIIYLPCLIFVIYQLIILGLRL